MNVKMNCNGIRWPTAFREIIADSKEVAEAVHTFIWVGHMKIKKIPLTADGLRSSFCGIRRGSELRK